MCPRGHHHICGYSHHNILQKICQVLSQHPVSYHLFRPSKLFWMQGTGCIFSQAKKSPPLNPCIQNFFVFRFPCRRGHGKQASQPPAVSPSITQKIAMTTSQNPFSSSPQGNSKKQAFIFSIDSSFHLEGSPLFFSFL